MSKHKTKKEPIAKGFQYTLNTDGACKGNPGPMGIGGVLRNNETHEIVARFSEGKGYGTNNEAEYLAVIRGLEMAKEFHPESLLVCADSQLVVYQITGAYSARQESMAALLRKAERAIRELACKVEFQWIRRNQNSEADALASKAAGMPMAKVTEQTQNIEFWKPNADSVDATALALLPEPHEVCRKSIAHLNRLGETARFRDFGDLKTGGIDKYSRMPLETLYGAILTRFGVSSLDWLKAALDESESEYAVKVYRWVARGLQPDLAMKKVSVDAEIAANAIRKAF